MAALKDGAKMPTAIASSWLHHTNLSAKSSLSFTSLSGLNAIDHTHRVNGVHF